MSFLQLYSPLYATANNALLLEEVSFSMSRTANAAQVSTVAKGFSGVAPGGPMCEIECDNAVPAAGIEFDAGPFIAALTVIEFACIGPGNKRCKVKGFILKDTIKHSVNTASAYSFSVVAPLSQFT